MREKLIELLQTSPMDIMGNHPVGSLADWLIANGVVIPVRCKDCKHWRNDDGSGFCTNPDGIDNYAMYDDFCSYGERRTDNAESGNPTDC